jgi:ribokinase
VPSSLKRVKGLRLGVVGHVEWADFVRVPHLPRRGEILHVSENWEEPAGGGAVTAIQLAKLAGHATLFTALGDDELGHRSERELRAEGLEVRAAFRTRHPQRRVVVHIDDKAERTITVIGDRMGPRRRDPLGWEELAEFDAVYFTAGDVGALRAARKARILTATARAMETLKGSGVRLDALVHSGSDAGERFRKGELDPEPDLVVTTGSGKGGLWRRVNGTHGRYPPVEPPGRVIDTYGAGDVFAGGFTAGLGAGVPLEDALELGARCGAWRAAGKDLHS